MSRVTSRDYRHPYRPPGLGQIESLLGRWSPRLDPEALVDEARRRTRLHRFDGEPLAEPLARLCRALEEEAQLTWTGWVLTHARLHGALASRLRVQACFDAHPELAQQPVDAPVFVTGLQRTGTTLLHRLLAATPRLRALASWEALNPAPADGWSGRWLGPERPRQWTALAAEHTLRFLAPDFFAVHPVEARAPEEEVVLMDHVFVSQVSEASYHVPSYARWVEARDHRPGYRYLRRCLQLLQWQRPDAPRRWVLKSPVHLEQLDALFEVFPDARVIQTHRHPRETIASFCSMVAHGRGVFSDQVDPPEVGRHWLPKVQRMVERAMATRDRRGEERFFDVRYPELIADPIGAAARVMAWTGDPLADAEVAALQKWMTKNRQHRFGRHVYDASDFELDEAKIDGAMGRYIERYGLV